MRGTAFFRRTNKALPVRSLLAATSHAAQGGSPASYSILPLDLPPEYCKEIVNGNDSREGDTPTNTQRNTLKHLCKLYCSRTLISTE